MSRVSLVVLVTLAMVAFAGNSLLCRVALRENAIDAASFTAIRIGSGALVLWLACRRRRIAIAGNWFSAGALFVYAAAFSLAYISLPAGTGALLLFAAVQTTMIVAGLRGGERLRAAQWFGVIFALTGLVLLLLPGIAAPAFLSATLMLIAGVGWGIYSLRGKVAGDPIAATAGNFIRALPLALVFAAISYRSIVTTPAGIAFAAMSGAITSGLGYVVWYATLPYLRATSAATVQLSAPVIAALGGVLLLGESLTARMMLASVAVLGGIALAIRKPAPIR
ncbi:MAG: DMT family transporter [Chthoniobacterales bacterium]